MERLNDIFSRAAQRRQQESDHRSTDQTPSQGLRPGAAPPRRPLPEQTARLGQPAHAPNAPQTGGQRTLPPGTRREQSDPNAYAQRPPYNQQRVQASRPTGDKFSSIPERGGWSPGRSMPSTHADAHHPMVQADVQHEWEDDTAIIRYGDWENDVYDERAHPQAPGSTHTVNRAAARIAQTYKGNRSMATRELHSLSEEEANLPMPMMRDGRLPVPLPPSPLTAPQEARQTHRATQPLNRAQTIVRMSQDWPPEAPHIQKPAYQRIIQEESAALIPAPYNANTTICPICKGAGFLREDVPYGHPNFGKPTACKCKEAERLEVRRQQLQEISNLGKLKEKNFRNFRPEISKAVENAYYAAADYAEDPIGWLVLIGRVGCGKTHLAAAIANQSLARGSLVLFSTVIDLLDHLRTAFSPTATEVYDQKLNKMREAALLVLDDLGAQQSTPWATEKLFQLLNYRYNYRIPTVITTNNVGLQGIDERIRSRLMDFSLSNIITIDKTVDYRPQNPSRE